MNKANAPQGSGDALAVRVSIDDYCMLDYVQYVLFCCMCNF